MHAAKLSWCGQAVARSSSDESGQRKTRVRRSKEERKEMVESFVKMYQKSNNGNFPSLNLTHKEVGGSFYTVREIVREIIQENRVLAPPKVSAEVHDQHILESTPAIRIISEDQKAVLNGVAVIEENHHLDEQEAAAFSKREPDDAVGILQRSGDELVDVEKNLGEKNVEDDSEMVSPRMNHDVVVEKFPLRPFNGHVPESASSEETILLDASNSKHEVNGSSEISSSQDPSLIDPGNQKMISESNSTMDRMNLRTWETDKSTPPENNPFLAFVKALITAFAKLWPE